MFPKDKPPARQNVAVKCCLHYQCSLTRKRAKFTDAQLLSWLFSGEPIKPGDGGTVSRKAEHAAKAAVML